MDFFIEAMKTKNEMSFSEYLAQSGTINVELIRMEGKIDGLIAADAISRMRSEGSFRENKQYKKAFRELRKTMIKTIIESRDIEEKHVKRDLLLWESKFQEGKMRVDLIRHFEKVSRQLKEIQKIL